MKKSGLALIGKKHLCAAGLPLKLQLYGMAYCNIHPKIIYHVTLLEGWKPFESAVLEGDWKQKFDARGNREWAGNPAGKAV